MNVFGPSNEERAEQEEKGAAVRRAEEQAEAYASRARLQLLSSSELVKEAGLTANQCESIIGPFIRELILELCVRLSVQGQSLTAQRDAALACLARHEQRFAELRGLLADAYSARDPCEMQDVMNQQDVIEAKWKAEDNA